MLLSRSFTTSAALQQYVLEKATPNDLIVVSHDRLARQLWHADRQRRLRQGLAGWEPLPILTLNQWFSRLFESLWPPWSVASNLERLRLWVEAMHAGPPLGELPLDLALAQRLDEAHTVLSRHLISPTGPATGGPPLVAWRRTVSQIFEAQLSEKRLLTPGQLPAYLLRELHLGHLELPSRILVLGFETPAPIEQTWFQSLAHRSELVILGVKGTPSVVQAAMMLPDVEQEMQWVAARMLELAHQEGLALHRIAVTSPAMDDYVPKFNRILVELLGPPGDQTSGAYNFSHGCRLTEHPLFQAAMLPLIFMVEGEARANLVSLLLSPYYGQLAAHSDYGVELDRVFREQGLDHGWPRLRQVWHHHPDLGQGQGVELLNRLCKIFDSLMVSRQSGRDWIAHLQQAWNCLGFPVALDLQEASALAALQNLLQELETTLGSVALDADQFLAWLRQGAQEQILAGSGQEEAGFQIMGLLEIRGLDFDRVFCLGLNAGTFPWPCRDLPMLEAAERRQVLGGTIDSQYAFAQQVFASLLGVAPQLTLTRPQARDQEPLVASPVWAGDWLTATVDHLNQPEAVWLRVPAIYQALLSPQGQLYLDPDVPVTRLTLPAELSVTDLDRARACPCWFFLEHLLGISPLPEIEAGLDARHRGARLHTALAHFVQNFGTDLKQYGNWDDHQAREILKTAVHQVFQPVSENLHWQVELQRWLSEDLETPGFLWQWLDQERQRYFEGWEWAGVELTFSQVRGADWPFSLRGRVDRLDQNSERGYQVWDYKCGQIPNSRQMFEDRLQFQLLGYLMALQQGRLKGAKPRGPARAGYIQLKSSRAVKYETWNREPGHWQAELAEWQGIIARLGQRLQRGDFLPDPQPAPDHRQAGACQYCPYHLICGWQFLKPHPTSESDL
ncbi:MAG: hypothetical protein DRG58_09360 [Deltaproteobacteria bacterium]|nr:MAG: hypothetical protein DRG58_09360 [Deltaproteobacteria bacterium]